MQTTSLLRTAVKSAVLSALLMLLLQTGQAQTGTVLYNFCSVASVTFPCLDGGGPSGSLMVDGFGNFWGNAPNGGNGQTWNNPNGVGSGTVFLLSPEPAAGCDSGTSTGGGWCENVIYNFCSSSGSSWEHCPDGAFPYANLLFVVNGGHFALHTTSFYGTTSAGGNGGPPPVLPTAPPLFGAGTVFEISPQGQPCPSGSNQGYGGCETVIYNFCSVNTDYNCEDGDTPNSGLVRDSTGNLYGTVSGILSGQSGVFELSPNGSGGWTEALIWGGSTNGGGLAIDAAGNLYGADVNQDIFELNRDGSFWNETILHTFKGSPKDGLNPVGTPVVDSAGNIYGTTAKGGSKDLGTVWKLSPVTEGEDAGTYKEEILHSFTSKTTGYAPAAGVTLDSSGNVYGTTATGGKYLTECKDNGNIGCGTVFELALSDKAYKYKLLWSLNETDGEFPFDNPILDSGNLYLTTIGGGTHSYGTVFEVKP
jgi:hypothetical protein